MVVLTNTVPKHIQGSNNGGYRLSLKKIKHGLRAIVEKKDAKCCIFAKIVVLLQRNWDITVNRTIS